jgi:hypothetical protein
MLVPKPPRTTLKQRLRSRIRQVRSLLSRTWTGNRLVILA